MILGKEDIIARDDLAIEDIETPEWSGIVRLRTLTGTERDAYEASIFKPGGKSDYNNLRAKLLVKCIVDDKGKRVFKDNEIDLLGNKSASVLDRLFARAQKLNGMGAKDAEEILKNLESGQSDDSASGSHES